MGLPANFWGEERNHLLAVLLPAVEEIAIAGVNTGIERLANVGITADFELAHAGAAKWARQYTDALLDRFNTVTQGSVGQVVENWIATPGATRKDLEARLAPILNDNVRRAETVGVTEVTRAMAQGEYVVYESAGVLLPPQFDTGVGFESTFGPPLHPNCRCWPRVVRLPNDVWIVVWQTNRDELVCTQKRDTPWGVVNGCREMNGKVLSAGQYMGKSLAEARRLARG